MAASTFNTQRPFDSHECPISYEIMKDPYIIQCCGQSFELAIIKEIVEREKECPMCRKQVSMNDIFPNRGLKESIENVARLAKDYAEKEKQRKEGKKTSATENVYLINNQILAGDEPAKQVVGKDVIVLIGDTGSGKSTTINFLCGCKMTEVDPKAVGASTYEHPIAVKEQESSFFSKLFGKEEIYMKEIAKIGHTKTSETLIPKVVTDPKSGMTFCDCPGFFDTGRGDEKSCNDERIANSVNIKKIFEKANSTKLILVVSFDTLKAVRGQLCRKMIELVKTLMGNQNIDQVVSNSIFICVTKVPENVKLDDIKSDFDDAFAKRVFIYSPIEEKKLVGGWSREKMLEEIKGMKGIRSSSTAFQIPFTSEEESRLRELGTHIETQIITNIRFNSFEKVASLMDNLRTLKSIAGGESTDVKIGPNEQKCLDALRNQFRYIVGEFDNMCELGLFGEMDGAVGLLNFLRNTLNLFDKAIKKEVNIEGLEKRLIEKKTYHEKQKNGTPEAQEEYYKTLKTLVKTINKKRDTDFTNRAEESNAVFQSMIAGIQKEIEELDGKIETNIESMSQEKIKKMKEDRERLQEEAATRIKQCEDANARFVKALEEQNSRLSALYNLEVEKLKEEKAKKNIQVAMGIGSTVGVGGAAAGAYYGATTGALAGPLGVLLGGAVGAGVGAFSGWMFS